MDPWAYVAATYVAVTMAFLLWKLRGPAERYFIRPMRKDDWGTTRFEIVDRRTGEVVGFDWFVNAKQRCAELNKS